MQRSTGSSWGQATSGSAYSRHTTRTWSAVPQAWWRVNVLTVAWTKISGETSLLKPPRPLQRWLVHREHG